VHDGPGGPRRRVTPEEVDQSIDRQRFTQMEEQDHEQGLLSWWPEWQTATLGVNHLHRPQDSELHMHLLPECPSHGAAARRRVV
jgi:hypothetical protein